MERLGLGRDEAVDDLVEVVGQPRDGRIGVDVAHRHVGHARILADVRADAGHQQRVRAKLVEEVMLGRDAIDAQHVAQRGVQDALVLGLRRDIATGRRREACELRLRQTLVVGLVGERHRDRRQLFEEGRNHVGRQLGAQRLRDLVARQLGVLLERVVGDEFGDIRLGFERRHRRLRDLRQVEQHRLDLVQLDAVAADLHLGVDAAAVFDLAVLVDAAEVAGAIDAARRVVLDVEKIADELLRSEFVAIHVAEREADAGDADLAELAVLHRLVLVRVEDDDRVGRERNADGHRLVGPQFGERRGDGRFGRAV